MVPSVGCANVDQYLLDHDSGKIYETTLGAMGKFKGYAADLFPAVAKDLVHAKRCWSENMSGGTEYV